MKASDQIEIPLVDEVNKLRQRITELEVLENEHKQTESGLRESEDRLKIILESVRTGIVIIDSETHRIVDANPFVSKLIGAPQERIIGSICHKYICPAEEGRCPVTDLGQTVDNAERVLLTAGGRSCPVIKTVEPVVLGGRKHLLECFVDITERKRMEEALHRSEELERRLAQEEVLVAEIGRIISSTLNIEEVYERFAAEARKLISFDRIMVALNNLAEGTATVTYASGWEFKGRGIGDVYPLSHSGNEEVLRTRGGLLVQPDTVEELEDRFSTLISTFQAGLRSMMSVPLISRGRVIGALHLRSKKSKAYTDRDLKLAERIAAQIAGAIANAQLFEEREQALGALREQEERYRSILETMEEGYFEVDLKGNFTFVNESLCKINGLPKEKLLGMNNREYMSEETAKKVHKIFKEVYSTGQQGKIFEWEIISSDGQKAIMESSVYLIRNAQGERIGFRGILREVTGRKQAEEALRRSEEEAKRLAKEVEVLAEVGRIISSTLNIEEVYGRFSDEVRKLIPFDRIGINVKNFDEDTVTAVYVAGLEVSKRRAGNVFPMAGTATGEVLRTRSGLLIAGEAMEEFVKRLPGYLPTYEAGFRSMMAVPLVSSDRVVGVLLLSSTHPNSYTKQDMQLAERIGNQIAGAIANAQLFNEHQRAEEALRKSEEKLRELYDNAPVGYHEYGAEGRITNVNQTDLDMLGYTREEMIGKPMWKFNVDEEMVRQQIMAKLAGQMPPGRSLVRTYRRKDGTTFPVLIEDRLIRDERGQIAGIRCTIQDITERKRAEEALQRSEKELKAQAQELQKELIQRRRAEEELARSNKELGQFAYVASHDLQEPLRMVTSYVQLLARRYRGKLDGDADEFIAFAVNGAVRMQQLINDLLTYSRVGTRGREFEPTDCEIILQQSLKNLQIAVEEKQAIVSHDPLPTLMADHVQLGQLFQNLIGNALKFQGAEPPHVHVSANRNGNGWVFSVRDNGIGIAPEYAERIFVIFQRLHSLEKYPGTGIGLAVCKKIVERHGGRIWVESDPGKGATFYFTLPGKGEQ